ncbi:MAG: MATE family efflux transporter [Proteobacteria bacterium]|nr:MATE family efflux transporter [Pseudomonadota bacterium]
MNTSQPSRPDTPNPRLHRLLNAPIMPLLARMSAPNIAIAAVTTMVTIADAWFVSRLGTTALASLAIVFPVQTLMLMMSAGAMGGGVSSAVARNLGGGRQREADATVLHAAIIATGMAALYVLIAGVLARPLFALLGGRGEVLDGAVAYAQVAFGAAIFMWLANTFAAVLRGTGDILRPSLTLMIASIIQVGLAGALTLGWGPFPALGIRGPATALSIGFAIAAFFMAAHLMSGRAGVRLQFRGVSLTWPLFRDILKVGAVACGIALFTISTILILTRLVALQGTAALAGYGLGNRLELIIIPLAAGVGGVMTALVGTNIGAGQVARARRIAWTGGLAVGAVVGLMGGVVAIWPALWLSHFTADENAYAVGVEYLRIVGPFYGMFGLGMALYFATQGTGNMFWPFAAGTFRLILVGGGGAVAVLAIGVETTGLFAIVAAGLVCFGGIIAASLFGKNWRDRTG